MDDARKGPLHGIVVLELAHVMAGPTCGRMLADMGADVIKIERLPGGDDTRRDRVTSESSEDDDSYAFMMMNRNKRGLALDLKTESGKAVLRRLLEKADVLIENYRHDTMAKLGFSYETLHETYPRLVYCAVSGFGRTGPYATRGGFDLVAQGMSGIMSFTGEGDGRPPVKMGAPVTDITAGILAAMGVCAALHNRNVTGKGQMVDTSLFEAGITFSYWHSAISFATGDSPGALGSRHPLNAPYQAYRTADGWINIGGANESNWHRLVAALDAEELGTDPRFFDNGARMANVDALEQELNARLSQRTTAVWMAVLDAAGVPAGPIMSVDEMHRDAQTVSRGMVTECDHLRHGTVKTIGFPVKFDETPAGVWRAAPVFGQHSREVLKEYGYADAEIDGFVAEGAIQPGA
ncbi:CaiB/BaiF CoA transferase family protein [Microbaculum marinisediminis]|uniref:CoA transferase n=1 Tax=Microbaculum marinisediminis TaxID=2931392 RepID=A0AAW5R335_9HYPH|nr:CoA transferase [Microbaculum sp. A6E488]MCT8974655.1 CoA transferase [Microbaculum sp. A6E488]